LKEYYVFTPLKKFVTLPNFQVIQKNKPWNGSPMSVLDVLTFIVKDWSKTVVVTPPTKAGTPFVVTVDKKPEPIPYFYSKVIGHREEFILIDFNDPATKLTLRIETSFGVKVIITAHPTGLAEPISIYSDTSVDIPRHPELRDNTGGILGKWNDNPNDDNLDPDGRPQALDDSFSWNFGNSWIIPSAGGPPSKVDLELHEKKHHDHLNSIPKLVKLRIARMCKANLDTKHMRHCAKGLGRIPNAIKDCIADLSYIKDLSAQKAFLKALVAKYVADCPNHRKIKFHKKPKPVNPLKQKKVKKPKKPSKPCDDKKKVRKVQLKPKVQG